MEKSKPVAWSIGSIQLELIRSNGVLGLRQQNYKYDLLHTLALAHLDDEAIANCALDIVFRWGHECVDLDDALCAYSENPLQPPPHEYLAEFLAKNDIERGTANSIKAIILSGSNKEADKEMLLYLLRVIPSDYMDGALYAASSFTDSQLVDAVLNVALSQSENNLLETGNMRALTACFSRWIRRGLFSLDALDKLLRTRRTSQASPSHSNCIINYVVCPHWRRLPYPCEHK
jgi:hypothetical protein